MTRGLSAVVLLWLAGCAAVAPLDEAERARIRVVVPVAALSAPQVDFRALPGRGTGAAMGVAGGVGGVAQACLPWGSFAPACMVMLAPVVAATGLIGAAAMPSNEGLEPMIERARSHLGGAGDLQKLLAQRFTEQVQRLTPYTVDPHSGDGAEGAVAANLAVRFVGATLTEPAEFFGPDYASRPVRLVVGGIITPCAQMRE